MCRCIANQIRPLCVSHKSRFILPLQSEDQVKLEKFNSDFWNKLLVSCLKLPKMYSPSVFFKDGLMLYVFESLKWKEKFNLKTHETHESPNCRNFFFLSNFTSNLVHFSTSLRPHYLNSFFLNNCFAFYSKLQNV